jgi:hypothetical protein
MLLAFLSVLTPSFVACTPHPTVGAQEQERPSGQTTIGRKLSDHDYCFTLEAPTDWRLLDEEAVDAFSPDAVAGLSCLLGPYQGSSLFVIVEPTPTLELDALADLCFSNLPATVTLVESVDTEYLALPAIRSKHKGTIDGVSVILEHVIFLREGFAYQVVAGALSEDIAQAAVNKALMGFNLLPGTPRNRFLNTAVPDQRGLDWAYEGGTFRCASSELALDVPEGWRVLLGDELTTVSDEAIVGLAAVDQLTYITLEVERSPGVDAAKYAVDFHAAYWAALEARDVTKIERVAGRLTEVAVVPSLNFTFLRETWIEGDCICHAMAWGQGDVRRQMSSVFPVLQAMRRMSAVELASLAVRLRRQSATDPFHPTELGEDFSYWSGVYRQFELGLVLHVPPAPAWYFVGGPTAEELCGEGVLAAFRSRSRGIRVKLEAVRTDSDELDLGEIHGGALEFETSECEALEVGEDVELEVAGVRALTTRATYAVCAGRERKQLWTLADPGRGRVVYLTAWGADKAMAAAQSDLHALVNGLSLQTDPMPEVRFDGKAYSNDRFGFTLTPEVAAGRVPRIKDSTPEGMANALTVLEVQVEEGECVVLALAAPRAEMAEEMLLAQFDASAATRSLRRFLRGEPSTDRVAFAGQEGTRRRYGTARNGVDVYVTARGRLAYALVAVGPVAARERMAPWLTLQGAVR